MTSTAKTLAASILLAAASAATAGPERDYNQPPPGAKPEDAKLWHELRDGTNGALLQLARAAQCSTRLGYGKYYEALDAVVNAGGATEASRAKAIREKVEAAARAMQAALPADGGRVHPCRVTLLDYEQRMDPRNTGIANELPAFREEARRCADRMGAIVKAVTPTAADLERALVEADAYLKREAPTPPATTPAGAPSPKS
jgi:hypothetical protein